MGYIENKESLAKKELRNILRDALEKLCNECRFILKQFYFEETSLIEIGKTMNKTHAAVRKQATRCRNKLRKFISEDFYRQYKSFFGNS